MTFNPCATCRNFYQYPTEDRLPECRRNPPMLGPSFRAAWPQLTEDLCGGCGEWQPPQDHAGVERAAVKGTK